MTLFSKKDLWTSISIYVPLYILYAYGLCKAVKAPVS